MLRSEPPQVAVLVDTSTGWGRQMVRGVISYARRHGPWRLWVEPHGQEESLRLPPGWIGQGVIARVSTHALARRLAAARAPVVNVSAIELRGVELPRVAASLEAQGRVAGEHLLKCGLRHFAYVGFVRLAYIKCHYQAFSETVEKSGGSCIVFRLNRPFAADWLACQQELAKWLLALPKPVGVLAWNCNDGRRVIDACRFANLQVPEQVAIVTGDDDDILCEACSPPLSGVVTPIQQIGRDAAALLDRLMSGRKAPKRPRFIYPLGVATRQSTDIVALEDQELAQAVRFIREHASQPIGVENVLKAVAISRRRLEMGFRESLGCSPAAEIRRVHLQQAKELLAQTDMSIPEVAAASGFGSSEYLAYVFKRDMGMSLSKYRRQVRVREKLPGGSVDA